MKKLALLVIALLLLCACDTGAQLDESNLEDESLTMKTFRFDYIIPMAGSYSVDIRTKSDGVHFTFETYFAEIQNSYTHVAVEKIVDKSIYEAIHVICQEHDIYSWDGFETSAYEGAMDTDSTSLFIEYEDERTISAYAGGAFPENHDEFYEALHEFTLNVALSE